MSMPQVPPSSSVAIPSGNPFQDTQKSLDWSRSDIERRLGFRGGRFTSPGSTLSLIIALLLTAAFYAAIILVQQKWPQTNWWLPTVLVVVC